MKCIIFGLANQGELVHNLITACNIQSGIDLTAYFQIPKTGGVIMNLY